MLQYFMQIGDFKPDEERERVVRVVLFYIAGIITLGIFASLFVPTLGIVSGASPEGGWRFHLALSAGIWLYGFVKARRYILNGALLVSYGWLLGASSISIVLILYALRSYTE